jgi:anti-sigma factor RsiW
MNHPHEDDLLLLAYGELDAAATAEVERHLASCAPCQERFLSLDRGRVAAEWAIAGSRRPLARWTAVTVLAAAAVAAILLVGRPAPADRSPAWHPSGALKWSATAGYLAGGDAVITIDAQLTRLEQEWSYARP